MNTGVTSSILKRTKHGSVLMEFIVVAPIYLMLLGGLFALGDLMLNRVRMHIGDRYVTWVGGSRFCPTREDKNGRTYADGKWVGDSLRPVFARSAGGDTAVDFKVNVPDDDSVDVNSFMALHMGSVTNMTVSLPGWVTGMMSVLSIVSGDDGADFENEYSSSQYSVNYYRTFVFLRSTAPDRLCIGVDAGEIASHKLADAVNDTWINEKDDSARQQLPVGGSAVGIGVHRMLGRFAE